MLVRSRPGERLLLLTYSHTPLITDSITTCYPHDALAYIGELAFESTTASISESEPRLIVSVKRDKGSDGTVTCTWATKEGSAVSPSDYIAGSGVLTFKPGAPLLRV